MLNMLRSLLLPLGQFTNARCRLLPLQGMELYSKETMSSVWFEDNFHSGFGCLLYMELRRRLQSVGIRTIFCWGDKESKGFWLKQGFVSVAEVDAKGRAHRIPIKAGIRRALCFPSGSTLMVSHPNKDCSDNSADLLRLCLPLKPHEKSSSSAACGVQQLGPSRNEKFSLKGL